MKIALIGPAYPYRGGIAHHTNMLARTLRRRGHSVDVITFTRQYPKILFPGEFQEEIGSGGEFAEEVGAKRTIDSLNPLSWWRTGRELHRQNYDLHIFKFWIPFFGPAFGQIARRAHHRGKRDIMIVLENFIPHEPRPGDRQLTHLLFRYCNMAITQSSTVARGLAERYPNIPQSLQPHPVYENFGGRIDRLEARCRAGVPEDVPVLLFFGFIRRYKGLDLLLRSMPEIARRLPTAHLLIVGEFYEDRAPYLKMIEESGLQHRIHLHAEYVPNEDVAMWFSASDMVVLPYRSATNSGIVQIAWNFGTPAIVTDVGSLSEVVLDGRTGYVLPDAEPSTVASAVERMMLPRQIEEFAANIAEERKLYSWDAFAEGIERLANEQGGVTG